MTLSEYKLRIKANNYRQLDEEYLLAKQAWYHQVAKSTKKNGRSAYRSFDDFFNYQRAEKKLRNHYKPELSNTQSKMARFASQFNKQVINEDNTDS